MGESNVNEYIDLVMMAVDVVHVTPEVVSRLIDILPEYPLIYPVLILMSMSIDYRHRQRTAKSLRSIKKSDYARIRVNRGWALWLVIFSSKLFGSALQDVVFFVTSILLEDFDREDLKSILTLCHILNATSWAQVNEFEVQLLTVLGDLSLTDSHTARRHLFKMCARALLLHARHSDVKSLLQQRYEASEFASGVLNDVPKSLMKSAAHLDGDALRRKSFGAEKVSSRRNFRSFVPKANSLEMPPEQPQFDQGLMPRRRRLRSESSLAGGALALHGSDAIDSIRTVHDLIILLTDRPPVFEYVLGIYLESEQPPEKSLLSTALDVAVHCPLKPPYQTIGEYLQSVRDRSRDRLDLAGLETPLRKFYFETTAKWHAEGDMMRHRLIRQLSQCAERSSQLSCGSHELEIAASDIDAVQQSRLENFAIAQRACRSLMREISHSWRHQS
jgi:hypothetical protein